MKEKKEGKDSKGSIQARAESSFSPPLFPPSAAFLLLSGLFLLLERCQSSDVMPESGGFALGLGKHEDLLLG